MTKSFTPATFAMIKPIVAMVNLFNRLVAILFLGAPLMTIAQITFDEPVDIATNATGARAVCIADMDHDGDNDILATGYFDDDLYWFENDGTGAFGPELLLTDANDNPEALAICDLDGDLYPDIAIVSFNDDKVSWLRNNAPIPCPSADFNFSGALYTTDILDLLGYYGCQMLCGTYDINYDGSVNTEDLLILISQIGSSC